MRSGARRRTLAGAPCALLSSPFCSHARARRSRRRRLDRLRQGRQRLGREARRHPGPRAHHRRHGRLPYASPSQADDGTVLAVRGTRFHKLDRQGKLLATFNSLLTDKPGTIMAVGPFDTKLSPDGTKFAYWLGIMGGWYDYATNRWYNDPQSSVAYQSAADGTPLGTTMFFEEPSWTADGNVLLFDSINGGVPQVYTGAVGMNHNQLTRLVPRPGRVRRRQLAPDRRRRALALRHAAGGAARRRHDGRGLRGPRPLQPDPALHRQRAAGARRRSARSATRTAPSSGRRAGRRAATRWRGRRRTASTRRRCATGSPGARRARRPRAGLGPRGPGRSGRCRCSSRSSSGQTPPPPPKLAGVKARRGRIVATIDCSCKATAVARKGKKVVARGKGTGKVVLKLSKRVRGKVKVTVTVGTTKLTKTVKIR